jgi:uncharacterized membrane protein
MFLRRSLPALLALVLPAGSGASSVDLRGCGSDPSWSIELRDTELRLQVGEVVTRAEVTARTLQEGRHHIEASTPDGRELTFEWWEQPCELGGQGFESTARLVVGSRTFDGCASQGDP